MTKQDRNNMDGCHLDLKLSKQSRPKNSLQHMATIDLGLLELELEDHHMLKMNRSKSSEEPYPSLKIVQKKEDWFRTSPKEKRRKTSKLDLRRSQSMDFDSHSECEELESKLFKLSSETDIQEFPRMRAFESRDVDVSDIYVKVPVQCLSVP